MNRLAIGVAVGWIVMVVVVGVMVAMGWADTGQVLVCSSTKLDDCRGLELVPGVKIVDPEIYEGADLGVATLGVCSTLKCGRSDDVVDGVVEPGILRIEKDSFFALLRDEPDARLRIALYERDRFTGYWEPVHLQFDVQGRVKYSSLDDIPSVEERTGTQLRDETPTPQPWWWPMNELDNRLAGSPKEGKAFCTDGGYREVACTDGLLMDERYPGELAKRYLWSERCRAKSEAAMRAMEPFLMSGIPGLKLHGTDRLHGELWPAKAWDTLMQWEAAKRECWRHP